MLTLDRRIELTNRLCYLFVIFLIGCLTGWIYEEIFYWYTEGMLRNRGILYGPWLPIYGVGALGIYAMKPFKKNPAVLFLLSAGITGVVEYRLDRDPLLRYAPVGLPGTIREYQRDYLRPQCGQLRPAGAGVPLSDRAFHGARDGQAEQEGGLWRVLFACGAAPDGLHSERTLSDAHYILRKKP